jgi:hypothetical protein
MSLTDEGYSGNASVVRTKLDIYLFIIPIYLVPVLVLNNVCKNEKWVWTVNGIALMTKQEMKHKWEEKQQIIHKSISNLVFDVIKCS